MKKLLLSFLLLTSTIGFTQKNPLDMGQIKKAKLAQIKYLGELIKDLPPEMKSIDIEFSAKEDGKLAVANCKRIELNESVQKILKNVAAGSELHIHVVYDGQTSTAKDYVFHPVN